jgi:Family of unknown function (DUF5990)
MTHDHAVPRQGLPASGRDVQVLERAQEQGILMGRLGLTDAKGNPTCTAGRPPTIEWFAAAA